MQFRPPQTYYQQTPLYAPPPPKPLYRPLYPFVLIVLPLYVWQYVLLAVALVTLLVLNLTVRKMQ